MDISVGLVQSYLNVNGYFTVVEYPVLEAGHGDHPRTVTDLDVLAFRFAAASHDVIQRGHRSLAGRRVPDPALHCPADRPDMIVGEVKEGPARFNPAVRDPLVLKIALARFGCCDTAHAGDVAHALLSRGRAVAEAGHSVRMVAFGDSHDQPPGRHGIVISMAHVIDFLRHYLHDHWDVLRHAQIRGDPALAVLALLEKWRVNHAAL